MSQQNSLMAAVATVLGATLGGLVLWRSFLTQRKRLTQGPSPAVALATQQKQPPQDKKLQQQQQPLQKQPPQKQQQERQQQQQQCHAVEPEALQVVPDIPQLSPPPPLSPPPASLPSSESLLSVMPVVVSSAEDWEALWPSLQQDLLVHPVLGLDCEWVSVTGKPSAVSLLQMATYTGQCVLVRLRLLREGPGHLPQSLVDVLSDLHVLKVGVGCLEDGKRLAHDHGLVLRCTVDLRFLALRQRHVAVTNGLSLKSLASDLLNITLDKSRNLRCSDWEADELTQDQVSYAARDAQVSVALFFHLLDSPTAPIRSPAPPSLPPPRGERLLPTGCKMPGPSGHAVPGRSMPGSQEEERRRPSSRKISVDTPQSGDQRVPDPRKNKRKPLGVGYSARKSPLYDNCFLHAPDGQPLCTCDKKKAKWYLDKGIGELQSEDPFVVRLLFEPSGRPESQQDYYLTAKQNLCVVCGKADSYIRKNIVPHEYRRYFPPEMKDHNCHDILLLCTACHAASCTYDGQLKQQLSQEHGAPQGCEEGVRLLEDTERRRVRSAARALLTARDGLPQTRCDELLHLIRSYMEQEGEEFAEVTQDVLQKAANLETRILNEAYVPHGQKVVAAYGRSGLKGLMELERLWREHFLSSMKPRFLPPFWSVSHNHEKFLRKYGENLVIELSATPCSPQSVSPSTPPEAL